MNFADQLKAFATSTRFYLSEKVMLKQRAEDDQGLARLTKQRRQKEAYGFTREKQFMELQVLGLVSAFGHYE